MSALTTLGTFHTAVGLVAVVAGLMALWRFKEIDPRSTLGRVYLWTTIVTCVTGLGIFQHGGFGPPHALALMTLAVLGVATVAERTDLFGRASAYVVTVGYSLTLFFHTIPGMTETFTRLPVAQPLFHSPEDPALKATVSVFFAIFLLGSGLQVRRLMHAGRHRVVGLTSRL